MSVGLHEQKILVYQYLSSSDDGGPFQTKTFLKILAHLFDQGGPFGTIKLWPG